MISRLSTAAAVFAVLATATLSYAVEGPAGRAAAGAVSRSPAVASAEPMPVVVLPTVQVTGKRLR